MLSNDICKCVESFKYLCDIYDNSAILVGVDNKSTILGILGKRFSHFYFIEEKVYSDGRIVIRALPKKSLQCV